MARGTSVFCYGMDQAPYHGVVYVLECKSRGACGAKHGLTYWFDKAQRQQAACEFAPLECVSLY